MLEVMKDFPDEVLAVVAKGKVTAEDYRDILVPEAKRRVASHGSLRMLYQFGPDFDSITPGASWQDMKLALGNWSHFARLAVVTDTTWIKDAMLLFAPIFHHPLRVFKNAEIQEARAWIVKEDAS